MTMECLAQKLRAIESEGLRPLLDFSCLGVGNPKAEHGHTRMLTRMTDAFKLLPEKMTFQEEELVGDQFLVDRAVVDVEVINAGVGA